MSNVIKFPYPTTMDLDASKMLKEIAKNKPAHALVITWGEGEEASYHSNIADGGDLLWQVQIFINRLTNGEFYE